MHIKIYLIGTLRHTIYPIATKFDKSTCGTLLRIPTKFHRYHINNSWDMNFGFLHHSMWKGIPFHGKVKKFKKIKNVEKLKIGCKTRI